MIFRHRNNQDLKYRFISVYIYAVQKSLVSPRMCDFFQDYCFEKEIDFWILIQTMQTIFFWVCQILYLDANNMSSVFQMPTLGTAIYRNLRWLTFVPPIKLNTAVGDPLILSMVLVLSRNSRELIITQESAVVNQFFANKFFGGYLRVEVNREFDRVRMSFSTYSYFCQKLFFLQCLKT